MIYTMQMDTYVGNLTLGADVILRANGFRLRVAGVLLAYFNATIQANGFHASGVTGGLATNTGTLSGGQAGNKRKDLLVIKTDKCGDDRTQLTK